MWDAGDMPAIAYPFASHARVYGSVCLNENLRASAHPKRSGVACRPETNPCVTKNGWRAGEDANLSDSCLSHIVARDSRRHRCPPPVGFLGAVAPKFLWIRLEKRQGELPREAAGISRLSRTSGFAPSQAREVSDVRVLRGSRCLWTSLRCATSASLRSHGAGPLCPYRDRQHHPVVSVIACPSLIRTVP